MNRESLSKYRFTEVEKQKLRDEITAFFRDEMEQEWGIIATEKILDFFLGSIADLIYNKALDDGQTWFKRLMDNAEADYYSLYKC